MTGNDVTYTYSTSGRTEDGAAQSERRANLFVFPSQSNVGLANPMHAAVDCSHYAYDYAGERTIKLTGRNSVLDVNADLMRTTSVLSEITIYPSPYVVLSNKGYTKHYYAGGDRVCARTGDGGLPMATRDAPMSSRADDLFAGCLNQCLGRRLDSDNPACIHGIGWDDEVFRTPIVGSPKMLKVSPAFEPTPFVGKMAYYATHDDPETDVYYYHSDHLGSASWITDNGGQAIQHLQYLPYDEPYINQRTSGYSEHFMFTCKERDSETGYGYFGARYMDHELMTMWLSVDPMCDKYPSISPYAYCAWNPVKLVDPDGRDIWEIDNKGYIVSHIVNDDYGQVHIIDDNGCIRASSCQYELGTLSEFTLPGSNATVFFVCGTDNADDFFMFLADNYTKDGGHPLEWGNASLVKSTDASHFVGTNHGEHSIHLLSDLTDNGFSVSVYSHNHPSGYPTPSGSVGSQGKDLGNAANHEKNHPGI